MLALSALVYGVRGSQRPCEIYTGLLGLPLPMRWAARTDLIGSLDDGDGAVLEPELQVSEGVVHTVLQDAGMPAPVKHLLTPRGASASRMGCSAGG